MRPPVGSNEDEPFEAISALLRGAAEFEPDEPTPGLLTAGGVALLLAEDAARQRRSIRARVATFAAVLTGAAACSASLVLALNQPRPQVSLPPTRPVQITQRAPIVRPAETEVAVIPPAAPQPQVSKRVRVQHSGRTRRPRAVRPAAPAPASPIWTEETVEREVTGVLAQGWLVQPQEDGSVEVTPTLVDVPFTSDPTTCDPAAAPVDATLENNEAR